MGDAIFFASASTTQPDLQAALEDLLGQVEQQTRQHLSQGLPAAWIDLAVLFVSAHHTHSARKIIELIQQKLNPRTLVGCTAEGVIGKSQEIENTPAISLVAARLPEAQVVPFILHPPDTDWHSLLLDPEEFQRVVGAPAHTRLFILLADPLSSPMDDILQAFNNAYPGIPAVGGMASGALRPHGNALFSDDRIVQEGVVGVAVSGQLDIDVVVSQGCRPIWRPFRVTSAHRNLIFQLDGRPPLAWIQDLIPELTEDDRALLQNGLFVGRAIKSEQESIGRGDFLIRGVIGVDHTSGAIAMGDSIMEGDMIQFHLRDAFTAQEDLEMMLIPQAFRPAPDGALLFSCNGRGLRLYDHPNGDISIINPSIGGAGLAGFFCAGEIGPIGGANYLHGHTVSLALFRSPTLGPPA